MAYGTCWLCGRNGAGDPLDRHHIFQGTNRKLSEAYGLTVLLCHDRCHENGAKAVHRCGDTAQRLHEYGQETAMRLYGWSVEDFRRIFGKNYLPDGWIPQKPHECGFRIDAETEELPEWL